MDKKAGFSKRGNIKLGGRVWTLSKLYGSKDYWVDRLNMFVRGTCSEFCRNCDGSAGCEKTCYVKASYRYGSVIYGHAVNTIAMRENMTGLFTELDRQLTAARNKPDIVRINQSGELESREEFSRWLDLAAAHPGTAFYLYTKAFKYIIPELTSREKAGTIPANFTILVSVWHGYGISEYKQLSTLEQVKAFAYMDGFNYSAAGLDITTYCQAYKNGKLDHNITCERCKKCFSRRGIDKVIGCNDH